MEEPFRGHLSMVSFLYFSYLLAFVGCHWTCFHPHPPISSSVSCISAVFCRSIPLPMALMYLIVSPGHIVMSVEVQHLKSIMVPHSG
jgi:hypothetical protein